MIEIKVNGDFCRVTQHGKIKDLSVEYLKIIMAAVEAFAGDIGAKREDILTLFYNEILEIYNDSETLIKKEV